MPYFLDRNLGGVILPGILAAAGIAFHRHDDHFPQDAPDEEWLPAVAERDWVILSRDKRILRVPLQRDAVFRSGARLLILSGASAPTAELAHNCVHTLPRIDRFLAVHPAPLIARVSRPDPASAVAQGKPGRIEMVLDEAEWRRRFGG